MGWALALGVSEDLLVKRMETRSNNGFGRSIKNHGYFTTRSIEMDSGCFGCVECGGDGAEVLCARGIWKYLGLG